MFDSQRSLLTSADAWSFGPQQDIWSTYVMNQVFDAESPQLVVLNGDLITGENTFLENSTDYIDEIVAPLVQRKLSWASTYGNHDSAFNLSRDSILRPGTNVSQRSDFPDGVWPGSGSQQLLPTCIPAPWERKPPHACYCGSSTAVADSTIKSRTATGGLIGQPNWVDQERRSVVH